MTEMKNNIDSLTQHSFVLGARALQAYILRMRVAQHERRIQSAKGHGKALQHNKMNAAVRDIETYERNLRIAMEALMEDVDEGLETVVELDREVGENVSGWKEQLRLGA